MWTWIFPRLFALLAFLNLDLCFGEKTESKVSRDRDGKLFPLFQIVTFPNLPCSAGGNKNGTCYTTEECTSKGGVNSGRCASGYGVCCTFTARCGGTSTENCTYFESSGTESGACRVTICRCDSNVCQMRLDFSTFTITGPTTVTTSVVKTIGGVVTQAGTKESAAATQCLTDTFSITNAGRTAPPVICGQNTGEHMYFDAADACNDLVFQLGSNAVGTSATTRQWSIKITQYSCDYNNLAPQGCTQYFFGMSTDTVKTFNYDGGTHLADQNQNICVRRERGQCKICWSPTAAGDFSVSGPTNADTAIETGVIKPSSCCGYGSDGAKTNGYDCVTLPGAAKATANCATFGAERICGRHFVTATKGKVNKTICSKRTPFNIRFLSDHYEFTGANKEANKPGVGAMLTYFTQAC